MRTTVILSGLFAESNLFPRPNDRMGQIKPPPPCVPFVAVFGSNPAHLASVLEKLEESWGPISERSPPFDFVESSYYHTSMGTGLKKQLALFRDRCDPSDLADRKWHCNSLEEEYATEAILTRPVNIDPGYVSLTKLVLASTKNREHRIYLRNGVYAEVTLVFRDQMWLPMPWTYADYQRQDVRSFLAIGRRRFAQSLHSKGNGSGVQESESTE